MNEIQMDEGKDILLDDAGLSERWQWEYSGVWEQWIILSGRSVSGAGDKGKLGEKKK